MKTDEYHIEVDIRNVRRRKIDHIKLLVTATSIDDARCLVMNALMDKFPKNDTAGDVAWDATED